MKEAEAASSKLETLRRWMEPAETSAVVLSSQTNFAWVTVGGRSHMEAAQAVEWIPSLIGAKSQDTVPAREAGPEVGSRTGEWPEPTAGCEAGALPRPALLQVGRGGTGG